MPENATQELVTEAIDNKPPPSKNADALIEQAQAEFAAAGGAEAAGGQMDLPGVPAATPAAAIPPGFNAELHETDAAGLPVLNTDGTLRRIRGRKSGVPQPRSGGKFTKGSQVKAINGDASTGTGGASLTGIAPEIPPLAPPAPQITREAARLAAATYVEMALSVAQGVFGEEWKEDGPDEKEKLINTTTEYVYATQAAGLSPGWLLVIAAGTYGGKRVQRPKTLEKLKSYVLLVRKWLIGR